MTIAVIGGGIAGFSAAIEATQAGHHVVLFDARGNPGGRARTRTESGFQLNEGAHALYVGGEANGFLRELGCEPEGGVPGTEGGVGIDGDLVAVLPSNLRTLLRTPLLRGDRRRLLALFVRLGRLDPTQFGSMTVNETVDSLVGRGPAAKVVHALLRLATYGNDPDRASGDAGIMQLKMAVTGGVRYLDGGWQTIVDSLAAEADRRGVEIRTGVKVTSLQAAESGVDLDIEGDTTRFDAAVVAVGGPRQVSGLLGDQVPAAWIDQARPAAVAGLDIGLDGPWGSASSFALGLSDPLYLSVHAPVARLAPDGHALVHVNRYLDASERDDADRDRAQCEALIDRIRPGWRDNAIHAGFNRRLVAAFDQPRAAEGGLSGRPSISVPGMEGVWIAGDWVGPAGLLADAAVSSGRAAGRAARAVRPEVVSR